MIEEIMTSIARQASIILFSVTLPLIFMILRLSVTKGERARSLRKIFLRLFNRMMAITILVSLSAFTLLAKQEGLLNVMFTPLGIDIVYNVSVGIMSASLISLGITIISAYSEFRQKSEKSGAW